MAAETEVDPDSDAGRKCDHIFYSVPPNTPKDRVQIFRRLGKGDANLFLDSDCGLGGRFHPQIAWAKVRALRDGAAIASKKLWS